MNPSTNVRIFVPLTVAIPLLLLAISLTGWAVVAAYKRQRENSFRNTLRRLGCSQDQINRAIAERNRDGW